MHLVDLEATKAVKQTQIPTPSPSPSPSPSSSSFSFFNGDFDCLNPSSPTLSEQSGVLLRFSSPCLW
ncbi:hypothetical protein F8388_019307 [Cannabis sativa]|uniref:Uncharacterized protein n=1 Tax=Cannabis sativa TaxID=3483 RepID=A0A7J6FR55_CANSA|nr:hypothetical protein F8388_019307 [Cannabis sativa]